MPDALTVLCQSTLVDLDALDSCIPRNYSFKFRDCTSNQAIALGQLLQPSSAALLERAKAAVKHDAVVQAYCTNYKEILDVMADLLVIYMQAEILPQLQSGGRVHIQSSPALAHNVVQTVAHARRIVKLFTHITNAAVDQLCIKIPSTWAGLSACATLEASGIHCLATILFTEHQALLAHQARCTYIAPYINELRVHFEAGYRDPSPNFEMVKTIHALYGKLNSRTMILPASLTTVEEVMALSGIEHLTISPALLALLAQANSETADTWPRVYAPIDRSKPAVQVTIPASHDQNGMPTDSEIDPEHARKFEEAMEIFLKAEADIIKLIEASL